MNNEFRREVASSWASANTSALPGFDLLNPKLVFGTAWFWTLPEVHDVQEDAEIAPSSLHDHDLVSDLLGL